MRRVAFYGGSFDPPTIAHIMVASHLIINEDIIDEQLVVPCFQHLEKKEQTDFEDRFDMCKRAFGWLPRTTVSNIEQELGGGSLTVRTIRALKQRNPDWHMYIVMGADLVARADTWDGWDELLMEATPLIVGRAGMPSDTINKDRVRTPICPALSSTDIRTFLVNGEHDKAARYLPREVMRFIQERGLYRNG
jgi:nicotinate-nucleotide adenylyltransferase